MTNQNVMNQPIKIIQHLPFEIIAIPQDNDYQQSNAVENSTNQHSFKIKIKNKKEPGVKRSVISVPKLNTSYNSKKVRLINSDQTILSFDLFMDAHTSKRTQKKNQNKIFQMFKPGCLNAQNEDDNDPYTSTSSNGPNKMQNISENNINNCNEKGAEKFALRKNFVLDNTATKPPRSFLGQCKPGGCLDPPYSEEKYPYKPTDDFSPLSLKADIDKKINQDGKFKSTNEVKAIITSEIEAITNDTLNKQNVNSLSQEENDDSLVNSLITYPHTTSGSKINIPREIQNNKTKPRTSLESKPKFPSNEFPEIYYMPPKKAKTKNSEAKYNKYENETPSANSKIINLLIRNEITKSTTPVENKLQSSEPIKVDYEPEYKIIKKTSQQTIKLFDCSPEWTVTSNEDIHKSVRDDTMSSKYTNNTSSVELIPVIEDTKFTTKTLVSNGSIKCFENPSEGEDINKKDILPDKQQKEKNELNYLTNILGKNSETQIKPNSKDLYVTDPNISLKTYEAPFSNTQSIHELFDSIPTSSISMISNIDKTKVDIKDINVLYKDEKLFNISPKTSQESLEKIDTRVEINKNELSDHIKKDKNTNNNVIIPSLSNTDNQLQIIKPEVTPEHIIENNLTKESKQTIDEILFTKQTESLIISSEKLLDTSLIYELNADNQAPNIDSTITPSIEQISKSQLRQDSKEIDSVINNDMLAKIKQLEFSPKPFQKSLRTPEVNEKISLQSLEFQSKDINTLSPTLDTLARKLDDPSNIKLADLDNLFARTEPNDTPKIDTKSIHSIENSVLEIKHPSQDFIEQNNDVSVLYSALNSPVKSSDTKINIEPDNIIKTDLNVDIFKDLNNEEEDLKATTDSVIYERTLTQQSFMVENEMKPIPLQVEMVNCATASNTEQNSYESNDKMKYNKISNVNDVTDSNDDIKDISLESSAITKNKEQDLNEIYFDDINNYTKLKENMVQSQSLEYQQKTNENTNPEDVGILNKINIHYNISSKTSLPHSMETVERSITNDTSRNHSKSSLKGNGKDGTIKGTSKELLVPFQIQEKSNDAGSLKIKDKYNENISQKISFLGKYKSPSQSVYSIQAQSREKTIVSNIISTVPEVKIDGNNDTDNKAKSKNAEQLNGETFNEIKITGESDYFATKGLIDLQGTEKNLTLLDYEGEICTSYKQPHKQVNSAAISSIAINFGFRAAKTEDKKVLIQTYDPTMPIEEKLEERITTIKSLIRENNKEIRIHINSETDLTLCITKNKIPTKITNSTTIVEEKTYIQNTSSSDKTLNYDSLLQETLNSVYDSLIPLQEVINNLTEEAKLLSQQQTLFRQLLSKMETKPLRILNIHQMCKCNKN
ncbi:unnamed protein product, partial [Brenthis ino]